MRHGLAGGIVGAMESDTSGGERNDIVGGVDAGVTPSACYRGAKRDIGFGRGVRSDRRGRGRSCGKGKERFATALDETRKGGGVTQVGLLRGLGSDWRGGGGVWWSRGTEERGRGENAASVGCGVGGDMEGGDGGRGREGVVGGMAGETGEGGGVETGGATRH